MSGPDQLGKSEMVRVYIKVNKQYDNDKEKEYWLDIEGYMLKDQHRKST